MCVENATISDLQQALAAGRTTAAALVSAYLARIEAYDRAGPRLYLMGARTHHSGRDPSRPERIGRHRTVNTLPRRDFA